jgi:hypothetical protein
MLLNISIAAQWRDRMIPDPLRPVSLHTALLESIAERYRRDNELEVSEHLEVLELFEGLQERSIEANGVVTRVGYHVKKLPAGEPYRIRFDRRNDSLEACLDFVVYDALHEGEPHASIVAVTLISDLMLRYRRLTSDRVPRNFRGIDCPRIPEARKLADAILIPASGIESWYNVRPDVNAAELASIYKVNKATADRRLKLFAAHKTALLAAAQSAMSVRRDVRLRIAKPGIMRRAINFFIHGGE